jgi:hypothetical protein
MKCVLGANASRDRVVAKAPKMGRFQLSFLLAVADLTAVSISYVMAGRTVSRAEALLLTS